MKKKRAAMPGCKASPLGAALLAAFSLAVGPRAAFPEAKKELNILLITIDTLRADKLGCYGNRDPLTPNIDGLAAQGFLFDQAFAHAPTTLPSHTSILTGMTPLGHGVHDNSNFVVGSSSLTLAEHLKSNGYATAAFVGAFPLDSRFGLTQGFDVYDDNYGAGSSQEFSYVERKAETVIGLALEWVSRRKSPWFLWIHCFDPHQRYNPPEPFLSRYKDRPYDGEIAYVDAALAPLVRWLKEKGAWNKTAVFISGDHGESLGEHGESTHGYFAYNATLRVPLILCCPGARPGKSEEAVCHADIFPTVCDLLGLALPPGLHGRSLIPVVKAKKPPARDIYFESLYPYYSRGWAPQRGIIAGGIKFIDSPLPELYDFRKDPGENSNLAATSGLEPWRQRLQAAMNAQSAAFRAGGSAPPDRQALKNLESLGYISAQRIPAQRAFSREDDLKILLPYQNKLMSAMGAYHRGQPGSGAGLLQEIISERKDFDLAYTYLAALYREQKNPAGALEVLRRGFQENPSSYRIITAYGILLADLGKADEAIAVLLKGLAIMDHDPELWNYLGVAYWKKGAFDKALDAYENALSFDHNYPIAFNNLGALFLSQFQQTKSQSSFRIAVEHFKKAIELDPRYASPYNGLGTAYAQAGDMDQAVANWKKAIELKPDYAYPLYNMGLVHLAKGDREAALGFFQKYKAEYYAHLPRDEKGKLDSLIRECRTPVGKPPAF
ncbi:MAG: sulfatase-like hydrolase/transferase [Acidobacteriota bacterium]|nr:sulfatase-like hydrolase/transferase [Acidobacteriota bacterium]